MTDLTNDEYAVMLIALEGESIAAIARWEKPIGDLVARGLLKRHDKFNHTITPEGRKIIEQEMRQRDQEMVGALQKVAAVSHLSTPATCAHDNLAIAAGGTQVVCVHCGKVWVGVD